VALYIKIMFLKGKLLHYNTNRLFDGGLFVCLLASLRLKLIVFIYLWYIDS